MNEFNLNDGFENYIVTKIFDAPSNDKNVWKKKKIHNSKYYINSFCYTIPKLTKIKNKNIYKKLSHYWGPTKCHSNFALCFFFFFLPLSLSVFTVIQKFILTYFIVSLLMSH